MPELPEVETIRRQLSNTIVGERMASIEVKEAKSFEGDPVRIEGETIAGLARQGKYLFFHTEKPRGIVGHLKMTGRLIVSEDKGKNSSEYHDAKHTRVIIQFDSGKRLYFWDTRKFGYLRVLEDSRQAEKLLQARLGPDPWQMKIDDWIKSCARSSRPIKSLILDQSLLAGAGNIYANDALWKAKLDPRRSSQSLTLKEADRLLTSLREVMERGLATGGASDNSYVDALGQKGSYQDEFLVYRQTGKPCLRDGTPITRIVIGGRGTWICETCQQ